MRIRGDISQGVFSGNCATCSLWQMSLTQDIKNQLVNHVEQRNSGGAIPPFQVHGRKLQIFKEGCESQV